MRLYDKFTLVATYIIKKKTKKQQLKTAVVKLKMAIFFTFHWSSICLRTLTISNLTHHHHHPLHPQYCCHRRHIAAFGFSHSSSSSSQQQRFVHIAAALLCSTDSDSSTIVPLYICTSQAVLKPRPPVKELS